jgi:hypothetical protein
MQIPLNFMAVVSHMEESVDILALKMNQDNDHDYDARNDPSSHPKRDRDLSTHYLFPTGSKLSRYILDIAYSATTRQNPEAECEWCLRLWFLENH